jgi:hypothetical protein
LKKLLSITFTGALIALSIPAISITTATQAAAWGHHHGGHHRGETCWRTNRHTGQHFRVC